MRRSDSAQPPSSEAIAVLSGAAASRGEPSAGVGNVEQALNGAVERDYAIF